MAAYSLFEEDEVCHLTPDKTYIYGLIIETAESVSSDEEDDPRRDVCKKGCVRTAWHPVGRESFDIPENKVLLADRALRPGDAVRRLVPGRNTQCGTVQDLDVQCHLHITGTDKYIYDVNSKNLSPCIQVHRYEDCYVSLDNWLGHVEEIAELVTLLLPDGARCQVDDNDICALEDVREKRPETSIFCEEYWYPGQQVKGVLNNLSSVTWLNSTLLYNARNVQIKKNSTFYATVEKVETHIIYVHWICRGFSKVGTGTDNCMQPPPREVKGDDINRLHLADWFEHCNVKLGDKMFYTIQENDVLETQQPRHRFVPYTVQCAATERISEVTHVTEDLLMSFDSKDGRTPRRKGSKKDAETSCSLSLVSYKDAETSCSLSLVSNNADAVNTKPAATTAVSDTQILANRNADNSQLKTSLSASAINGGCGDIEGDADDEYEDVDDDDLGCGKADNAESEGDSDAGSNSSALSASEMKRRKFDKQTSMPTKSQTNIGHRRAKRRRPVPEIQLSPGTRVATEVCYTFTWASVMWQDGTVEERVPSVELFPLNHLDELEFFPGFFVVDSKAEDTSSEYGVIMSCDHFERTCQVKWLKPYEVGHGTFPTEVIKAAEVSVYDIQEHPDYRFRPGHSVIRIAGFEDADQTLQAVGQVTRLNADGTIAVKWTDTSTTASYPQDLYIVYDISDYSDSSWEMGDTSGEEDESDASWETEEEEDQKEDGEESGAHSPRQDDDLPSLKNLSEDKRKKIQQLLSQGLFYFNELHDLCSAHVLSQASSHSPLATPAGVALLQCMHDIIRIYRSCRRLDRMLKTCYFSGPEVTGLLATIKGELRKEKSNKIKEQLEQMFEACNKGLLEGNKHTAADQGEGRGKADTASKESTENKDSADPKLDAGDMDMAEIGGEISQNARDFGAGADSTVLDHVSKSRPDFLDSVSKGDPASGSEAAIMQSRDSCSAAVGGPLEAQGNPQDEAHISSMLAAAIVSEGSASADQAICRSTKQHITEDAPSVADEKAKKSDSEMVLSIVQVCVSLCRSIQSTLDTIHSTLDTSDSVCSNQLAISDGNNTEKENDKRPEAEVETTCLEVGEMNGTENCWELEPTCADGTDDQHVPSVESNASNQSVNSITAHDSGNTREIGFEMCNETPATHVFINNNCQPNNQRTFNSAVKKELKLLKTSLPPGILVKGYEDRMDLFSVLIDGPAETPYEDGVFLFDVMLPQEYPASPPVFHFHSFCQDRLNPNLYPDGKVCVSLLGTWSGKGMEVWTEKSNLLQVLISIQGLILVDEPYYNEAGYEKQRGQQIANENSRLYNEMAILKFVQSLTAMTKGVSEPFRREVQERLQHRGPRISERLHRWLTLSEKMGDARTILNSDAAYACVNGTAVDTLQDKPVDSITANDYLEDDMMSGAHCIPVEKHKAPPGHPRFPLLPMSKGFRLTLQKSLLEFEQALAKQTSQGDEFKTEESLEVDDQMSQGSSVTAS